MFTTSVDGQTVVDMHVVQGERELAKDCRSLARFELRGIDPDAGRDAEDRGDVPHRRQRHPAGAGHGSSAPARPPSIEVKPTYGLTEADVERMVEDSFTYAEADVETRLLIETRNEADTVLTHVERALRQGARAGRARRSGPPSRRRVAALRQAREGQDRDAIRERDDRAEPRDRAAGRAHDGRGAQGRAGHSTRRRDHGVKGIPPWRGDVSWRRTR